MWSVLTDAHEIGLTFHQIGRSFVLCVCVVYIRRCTAGFISS